MSREYAIYRMNGEERETIFRSEGFDPSAPCEAIELQGDCVLLLSGHTEDEDRLIIENRELERLLREEQNANQAKEAFLSSMSHDIRTPMNAIVGLTALAKKHIDEKGRVADALDKIEIASAHLLSLINDVLDMSRINSGRLTLADGRFSLGDLLHETLVLVRPQIEQRGHAFQFEMGEIPAEELFGDALRLRQIFVNIIGNAVKYTKNGGAISVFVGERLSGDRCELTFRCQDNGIGMSEEFLGRIFRPFERAADSTTSRIEGTGLGMSIVKKLTDIMGGTIDIQSALGEGTVVTITVPMRYDASQADASALRDKRLLIIEADEAMQAVYRRYLGEFGIRHDIVPSASGAIETLADADFRGERCDAVIIGKAVEQDGTIFDLAGYLHKAKPQTPIILISEHSWPEIEYHAGRSGIERFIPVPFFRKSLIRGLSEAVQATAGQETAAGTPNLAGRRILLAEDNDINREIACELLSITGAEVDAVTDGSQAVEKFAKGDEKYDLILMDVQMPVMDGYTAVREIRASGRPDARTIPIFAMTANTFAEDIAKARAAGMDGHIAKPIDINAFMQVLRQIQ